MIPYKFLGLCEKCSCVLRALVCQPRKASASQRRIAWVSPGFRAAHGRAADWVECAPNPWTLIASKDQFLESRINSWLHRWAVPWFTPGLNHIPVKFQDFNIWINPDLNFQGNSKHQWDTNKRPVKERARRFKTVGLHATAFVTAEEQQNDSDAGMWFNWKLTLFWNTFCCYDDDIPCFVERCSMSIEWQIVETFKCFYQKPTEDLKPIKYKLTAEDAKNLWLEVDGKRKTIKFWSARKTWAR